MLLVLSKFLFLIRRRQLLSANVNRPDRLNSVWLTSPLQRQIGLEWPELSTLYISPGRDQIVCNTDSVCFHGLVCSLIKLTN